MLIALNAPVRNYTRLMFRPSHVLRLVLRLKAGDSHVPTPPSVTYLESPWLSGQADFHARRATEVRVRGQPGGLRDPWLSGQTDFHACRATEVRGVGQPGIPRDPWLSGRADFHARWVTEVRGVGQPDMPRDPRLSGQTDFCACRTADVVPSVPFPRPRDSPAT